MGIKVNLAKRLTPKLLAHSLYRGMQARVAGKLGVSRAAVSQVASGRKKSTRIQRALLQEAKRIERRIQKKISVEAA